MGKKLPPQPDQEFRRARLQALLDEHFESNKAALGRYLGYDSGHAVWQMLDGRRPITDRFIQGLEERNAGQYAGWFARRQAHTALATRLAEAFDREVPEAIRQSTYMQLLSQIRYAADAARAVQSAGEATDLAPSGQPQLG